MQEGRYSFTPAAVASGKAGLCRPRRVAHQICSISGRILSCGDGIVALWCAGQDLVTCGVVRSYSGPLATGWLLLQ